MKKTGNRSVTYNFIMNVILTGSNILFPLLTYPYASRILKPYGMGMVSFANAIITYFTMFAQLGIPTYGIRVCAKVRDDREKLSRTVQEVLIINMITCFLSYAAFFAAVFFTPRLRQEKTLFLVMGILIFFNTLGVEWLYKGLEQYTYITVRSIIFKFVAFVCIFVFIHNSDDYVAYGFFTVLALVGSNAMNFINLHKMISVRPVGGYHFRQHLKPIFVFFGMSVATTIYTNMDSVMLGFIKGADENGCYDAAVKIKNILVSVVTSLGTVLLPRVSYHWEKGNRKEFWKLAKKAAAFEIIAGGSLAMFFIIFAKPTIYLVSGKLFERAILPMEIIMPTLLLIGLSNITGIQILIPMGKEKYVLYSEITGAVSAELVVLAYQMCVLKKDLGKLFGGAEIWKSITAVCLASVASIAIRRSSLSTFPMLLAGGIVFFLVYGIVLLVLKESIVCEYWNTGKMFICKFMKKK